MSFFKRLFSSKKSEDNSKNTIKSIHSSDYFNSRYEEQSMESNATLIEGSIKMIESYFLETKLVKKRVDIVNHPYNLDQVIDEGMGFDIFCRSFNLDDNQTVFFLAFSFSEFLISNHGFKLYRDKEPEYPLRSMTLKYDKKGVVMSLYPYEFASKVVRGESKFENLYSTIQTKIETLPYADTLLNNL